MDIQRLTDYYNKNSELLVSRYESISFEDVHGSVIPFLPKVPSKALDIGAGSGRDAAWLASKGFTVTAVEPAIEMIRLAKQIHRSDITWLNDSLPELKSICPDQSFELVLLSGVWMHLTAEERQIAIKRINKLTDQGGIVVVSLRHDSSTDERKMHSVSLKEIKMLIKDLPYKILDNHCSTDKLNRNNVFWETVILKKLKHS